MVEVVASVSEGISCCVGGFAIIMECYVYISKGIVGVGDEFCTRFAIYRYNVTLYILLIEIGFRFGCRFVLETYR